MNVYVGKTCPFCKVAFQEDDDIVVCSVCDMPHHKECWVENQGCTTFGCMGTIKSASDNQHNSVTATVMTYERDFDINLYNRPKYCGKCGAQNDQENAFCEKCGQRLTVQVDETPQQVKFTASNYGARYSEPYSQPMRSSSYEYPTQGNYINNYAGTPYQGYAQPYSQVQRIDPSEEANFIGENSEYYVGVFQTMRSLSKKTSWNTSAFLFGGLWYAYRKMYLYAAVYASLAFFISLSGTLGSIVSVALTICSSVFGNYLYMTYVQKKLQEERNMSEPFRSQHMLKNGGTSAVSCVLFVVGYFAILVFLLSL